MRTSTVILIISLLISCRSQRVSNPSCLTGDGKTVDFVTIQNNKTCLTVAELEMLRGNDQQRNVYIESMYGSYNSHCAGLYVYMIIEKPSMMADHANYCCFLKFEDKIVLADPRQNQDSILKTFFEKEGKKCTPREKKEISEQFKKGCQQRGGF